MNQIYFLLLIIGMSYSMRCHSQISFIEGYYINNSDEKTACFIKNVDWKNNPLKFEYKSTKESEKKTLTIESVKEFEIINVS